MLKCTPIQLDYQLNNCATYPNTIGTCLFPQDNLNIQEYKISLLEDDFEPVRLERPMEKKSRTGLKGNDIVIHGVFGEGIVLSVKEGLAEIAFPFPHGIKKILASHPSLRKKNS